MTAGSYEVVGEHAQPSDFRDYLLTQLMKREPLHLEAVERHNELAVRRGLTPREFTFTIRAYYVDRGVETTEVINTETGEWLHIKITGLTVTFDLLSD